MVYMKEPQEIGDLGLLGDMHFCNEAVFLDGQTAGLIFIHHEGDLAFEAEESLIEAGGFITGDAALYI